MEKSSSSPVPPEPRLRELIDALPVRVFWKDLRLRYLGCNLPFARDAGFARPEDLVGKDDFDMPWKDQAATYRAADSLVIESGEPRIAYEEPQDGPAGRIWLRTSKLPLRDRDGAVVGVIGTYEDVSAARRAEAELAASREALSLAIEGSGVGLWDWRADTGALAVNARWAEMLGWSLAELSPVNVATRERLCHPEDLLRSNEALRAHFAGETPDYECEVRMLRRDGSWAWILDRGRVAARDDSGRVLRVTGTHLDITERKRMEEELRLAATTDKLTGARNRRAGLEDLERELRAATRRDTTLGLCYVDVDGLKSVNDRLGHAAGDALIVEATRAIAASLRTTDTLCRLGGDEFAIILPECDEAEAEAVWARVERRAAAAGLPGGATISLSRGFAFSRPGDRPRPDELVARADAAMYAARLAARGAQRPKSSSS